MVSWYMHYFAQEYIYLQIVGRVIYVLLRKIKECNEKEYNIAYVKFCIYDIPLVL